MNAEVERLRNLPKQTGIREGVVTIDWPANGSKRIRCFFNGVEVDPSGVFDNQGRTNWERLLGKRQDANDEPRYTNPIESA